MARSKSQLSFCFDPLSPSQKVLVTVKEMEDPKAIFNALNKMFVCMHDNRTALESQMHRNEERKG